MKFTEFSEVKHGTILSRVKDPLNLPENKIRMVSMQDLSYHNGYSHDEPEPTFQTINPDNRLKCILGNRGDIIIGLTVNNAMVLEEDFEEALIPSNFAVMSLDNRLANPYYIMWYINESNEYKRQSEQFTQGSSVRSLSIRELREMTCNLPPLDHQMKIGNIYQLVLKKEKLQKLQKEYSLSLIKGIKESKGGNENE